MRSHKKSGNYRASLSPGNGLLTADVMHGVGVVVEIGGQFLREGTISASGICSWGDRFIR